MSNPSMVRTEHTSDGIAILTIDAPPLNLYSRDMHAAFDVALDEVESTSPRAVLIRAEGKVVSGGVDVSEFDVPESKEAMRQLFARMIQLPDRIAALSMPTIFAAHALTLTWALEIGLACDLLLASDRARFGLVERVIGLTPTMGGTQRIAARAGIARAKQVVFTGDLFTAQTLEAWNIVNQVMPSQDFDSDVLEFVQAIAVGPTIAFGAAKELLNILEAEGVSASIAAAPTQAAELFDTEDLKQGITTFLREGPGKGQFHGR